MEILNPLTIPRGDARYLKKVIVATCQTSDLVGNCVHVAGPDTGGIYQVTTADPSDYSKMPAIGVIESKQSSTECLVRVLGEVLALYTSLTPGSTLFVGPGGLLSAAPPVPITGGYAFVQGMGVSLSSTAILLVPSFSMTKRIW